MKDPTKDGGDGGRSSDSIKRKVVSGKRESENRPWDGGVLISMTMHGRRHEYARIAWVVLAFALTTGDVPLSTDTATTAVAAVAGSIVGMAVVVVSAQRRKSPVLMTNASTTHRSGVNNPTDGGRDGGGSSVRTRGKVAGGE